MIVVVLSVLVQIPLAVFLGHYYDQRSLIDTGYLVSSGLNPYLPHTITVFSNPHLIGVNPIIGYPPLWPLLLGVIYRLTYNLIPNIFLYNFAIKIPVIAANIALAYATKTVMQNLNMPPRRVRFAWLFLLFNPFTLLTTTAWGQFDTLIALLCVVSLYSLSKGSVVKSSILLSLSIVLKPISLPLIGLPLFFAAPSKHRKNLIYILITIAVVVGLAVLPFNLLGWMAPSSPDQVTSYFRMAGGMTLFNIVEIFQKSATVPIEYDWLGYLWIPATIFGYYLIYRNPPKNMLKLVESAVVLLLIFFLTRSWLSEPNLNILLPLFLILFGSGKLSLKTIHLAWVIPFIFLFLNYATPQLFFLVYPPIMSAIGTFDLHVGVWRLIARFVVAVLWYILALKILGAVLRKK
jgi:Gpi18-like mannosyltransferase